MKNLNKKVIFILYKIIIKMIKSQFLKTKINVFNVIKKLVIWDFNVNVKTSFAKIIECQKNMNAISTLNKYI